MKKLQNIIIALSLLALIVGGIVSGAVGALVAFFTVGLIGMTFMLIVHMLGEIDTNRATLKKK